MMSIDRNKKFKQALIADFVKEDQYRLRLGRNRCYHNESDVSFKQSRN